MIVAQSATGRAATLRAMQNKTQNLSAPAARMHDISPFHVMELMGRAKALEQQGHDIVHMEVGEPDFPTSAPVIAAAQAQLASGNVFYTHALGLSELRSAISDYYRSRYDADVPAERIVITTGASGALLLALGVLVDRDSEWLLPDPAYPCNANFLRLLEGKAQRIAVDASTRYQPTPQMIDAHWHSNTRGLLLASPANPSGTLLSHAELQALHQAVQAHQGHLIVDEIYHGLTYGCDASSATTVSDDIFVLNSFSKYFGMTGWRLGWLVVPPAYVREVEKLAQNLFISPPTLSQYAALAALAPENIAILEARREAFAARRSVLLQGLRALGFGIDCEPTGAFYIYARLNGLAHNSFDFAMRLLQEAHVAVTPGIDFGQHGAVEHVRFAYTTDIPRLEEGLRRIAHYLSNQ